jgi:hypothetical protein
MKRTYLALAGLGLAMAAVPAMDGSVALAQGVFTSVPVDASRFAVLAKPVGSADWSLLVLEQLAPRPLCWEQRPDGLVDPSLNRFDFTGICSRYLDSNGYSLRVADQDLASRYRLRLRQVGQELQLQAMSPTETTTLVVGRGTVPLRDRDAFVAITLEPDWQLNRRAFGNQTLSHVYFANGTPLEDLLARAAQARGSVVAGRQRPLPGRERLAPGRRDESRPPYEETEGPIALQVVPFEE